VKVLIAAVALLVALLAACDPSPEAARVRGGGPGADVGNRPADLQIHGGNESAFKTPNLNPTLPRPSR